MAARRNAEEDVCHYLFDYLRRNNATVGSDKHRVKVTGRERDFALVLGDNYSDDVMGAVDTDKQEILVHSRLKSYKVRLGVVVHEIVHQSLGMKDDLDEEQVDLIERGILEFLVKDILLGFAGELTQKMREGGSLSNAKETEEVERCSADSGVTEN